MSDNLLNRYGTNAQSRRYQQKRRRFLSLCLLWSLLRVALLVLCVEAMRGWASPVQVFFILAILFLTVWDGCRLGKAYKRL